MPGRLRPHVPRSPVPRPSSTGAEAGERGPSVLPVETAEDPAGGRVSLSGFAHLSRRTLDGKGGARDADAPSARREARPRSGLRTVRAVPRSPPSRRQARPQHSLRGLAVGIKGNETCVPLRDDRRAHVAVTAVAIPGDRGPRGLAPVTGRGAEARPPHEQTRDQAPPHSQP